MENLNSKDYFEIVAEDWDKMGNSFFGNAPRDRIYKELNFKDGMTVADLGCGTGYLLEGLTDKKLNLIAVDQSEMMLEQIKVKFHNHQGLTVIEGTSEALGIPDESVDIAIFNMYLHHVEMPGAAIKEISRILKKGGIIAFTDLDLHEHEFLVTEQHDRWMGFDRKDIIKWLTSSGFTNVEIDCVGAQCCAESCSSGENAAISIFFAKATKT